ncbi:MAG: hypothetical protein WBB39_04170 [Candidatus Saccharimonadales bacterium]
MHQNPPRARHHPGDRTGKLVASGHLDGERRTIRALHGKRWCPSSSLPGGTLLASQVVQLPGRDPEPFGSGKAWMRLQPPRALG